jgi:hypothetical protein
MQRATCAVPCDPQACCGACVMAQQLVSSVNRHTSWAAYLRIVGQTDTLRLLTYV